MFTKWTQHLRTDEDKERFRQQVLAAKPVLERLLDLMKSEEDNLNRSETSVKTFDTPNWAYLQAFKNGYRSCLNVVKTTIDLDQQKENTNDR